MKLCKHCKYGEKKLWLRIGFHWHCTSPLAMSLIDGSAPFAETIRHDERYCGVTGKWWKPVEVKDD